METNNAVRRLTGDRPFNPHVTGTVARDSDGRKSLVRYDGFLNYYASIPTPTTRSDLPNWEKEVVDTLVKYTRLPNNWDSYAGVPVRWDVGMFALSVLSSVMQIRTPAPHLVPSSEGALQIEWHEKGIDLEIYITAPYVCEIWYQDSRTNTQSSEELSTDFTSLAVPISELTSR